MKLDMNSKAEDFRFLTKCILEVSPLDHIKLAVCLKNYYGIRAKSANGIAREARVDEFIATVSSKK